MRWHFPIPVHMQALGLYLTPLCIDQEHCPVWGWQIPGYPYTRTFVENILLKHSHCDVFLGNMVRIQLLVAQYDPLKSDHTWEETNLPASLLSKLRADRKVVVAFALCSTARGKDGVLFVDYIEALWKHKGFASKLMGLLRTHGRTAQRPLVLPRIFPVESETKDIIARQFWRDQFLWQRVGDPESIRNIYNDLHMLNMEGLDFFLDHYWEESDMLDCEAARLCV
jgi:hypothetical protein